MPYVLGIDIGSTATAAAVARLRGNNWDPPEPVRLGPVGHAVPSVLLMSSNRSITVADPDEYDGPVDSGWVARDFAGRIGDGVPLLLGGEACSAQALSAMLAMWVVERVMEQEREHPDWIVLSHPAGWGDHRRHLLGEALWDVGLGDVALLPAPVLVAASHAAHGFSGRTLAVHTLGGQTWSTAVVDRAQPLGFELRTGQVGAEPLGGADFDEALVEHVRSGLAKELADQADPLVRQALLGLRRESRRAKIELTLADTADVPVRLPARQTRVPVRRAEFEDLIRPAVTLTVQELVRTVRSCGLAPHQLDGVLLAGGSARIPLVRELVAARFPVPVEVEADPQLTIAAGAAVAGYHLLDRQRGNRPPPRPPVMRPPRPGVRRGEPPARRQRGRSGDGREPGRYDEDRSQLPPRPPIRITPLELPMRKLSRFASGRDTTVVGLAALLGALGGLLGGIGGSDPLTVAASGWGW
ncbi:Hsp70 family protein [Micromonospora sp. WMMD1102]|uniref:Hsp70 family protein n=1 Tax=Micromonospora sp. WMMD1102 TaxID=3016105 RepID=UPI0024158FDC|nr:Hsp70 family protein [Micromonospora sp. WMMD1102]MDG4784817.1 Hsp70 family protein [Micromonospora sp. WMMD1102]